MIRLIPIILITLAFCVFPLEYAGTQYSALQAREEKGWSNAPETPPPAAAGEDPSPPELVVIEINGMINPATLDYIRTGIEESESRSAEALVILLDTPGGLLNSTKEIVKLILNSPVPVVVFVSPKGASATSAGVFITLSANIAAMAPGTSIGAAHPVSISPSKEEPERKSGPDEDTGEDKQSKKSDGSPVGDNAERDIMGEKLENYASSFIESIAEERGRNVEWAEEAVRKSSSITATEALKMRVIDLIAPDLDSLIKEIDGKKVKLPGGEKTLRTNDSEITRIAMNAKQKLVDILSTPDIAFLLLSLGSLGLLLEFYNPGLVFPGVAGAVCLLMGFVSFQILPFNYAGIALLVLGIALFISEIYVSSYGVLTLGGLTSFALGALLLFDTPESDLRVGFDVVIASTLAFGLFFAYVIFYLIKAQKLTPRMGFEGIIGKEGSAVSEIQAVGKIYIDGEYWDAESEQLIQKGDRIKVVEVLKGFKLKVKKV
ncbi:MAG: NfeD family protein [Thermodesulfobacteriota bacterium]